jgi:hypothetical protein
MTTDARSSKPSATLKLVVIAMLVAAGAVIWWVFDYSARRNEAARETMRRLQLEQLRIQAEGHNLTPLQRRLIPQIESSMVRGDERATDSLLNLATKDD